MQAFVVTVERRRVRHQLVVAASARAAHAAMLPLLGPRDRITGVRNRAEPMVDSAEPALALAHLASCPFLAHHGPQTVGDWLRRGGDASQRDAVNAGLALAGLRILGPGAGFEGAMLAVGAATSIPFLNEAFRTTPWAGPLLAGVLASLPGTRRSVMSFAGIKARAVSLPLTVAIGTMVPA
jgi:hypothetical protein